jgi:hypothetical protein
MQISICLYLMAQKKFDKDLPNFFYSMNQDGFDTKTHPNYHSSLTKFDHFIDDID